MRIDNNTSKEEVTSKTKDSLNGLCEVKNNESDNGKATRELFNTYRTGRIVTSRKKFSEYDFIRLFLATLLKKGTIKFDSVNLGYRLIDFYRNEEYHELFDMHVIEQIEGDYIDMSSCLNNALLSGLISLPVQGTYTRLILIPNVDEIINSYNEEYKNKMDRLVNDYLLQEEKMITASGLVIEDIVSEESKSFAKQFVEKLSNDEYKKEMCPKPEFVMTDDFVEEELDKYNKLLDSDILEAVTMGETLQILKQEKEVAGRVNKDCRTCQNMSCRVEQHEKPVEGCLGYINHDKVEDSSVRRILAKRKNKSN